MCNIAREINSLYVGFCPWLDLNASRNITLYIKTPFQSLFANASLY